jgi:hypothetical protein
MHNSPMHGSRCSHSAGIRPNDGETLDSPNHVQRAIPVTPNPISPSLPHSSHKSFHEMTVERLICRFSRYRGPARKAEKRK